GEIWCDFAKRRLVNDRPEGGRIRSRKHLLAQHPRFNSSIDLVFVGDTAAPDDSAGILFDLEQARDQQRFEGADCRCLSLQAYVGAFAESIGVRDPPAALPSLLREGQVGLALSGVGDLVDVEQY